MNFEQSYCFTGRERIILEPLIYSIKNSFTYEFWVKPQSLHSLSTQSNTGISNIKGQNFLVIPEYGGIDQAGIGVSIAYNGIAVYEHTENHFPATLVYPTNINNWTHIAIVFRNKTPYLYINGEFVKTGFKSTKSIVYPSGNIGGKDNYGFFSGFIKEVRIWDHARTQKQIKEYFNIKIKGNEPGLFLYLDFNKSPIVETRSGNHDNMFKQWENYIKIVWGKEDDQIIENHIVDVIIPIYNSLDLLKRCIHSVYQNSNMKYNLILMNDCSTDNQVKPFLENLKKSEKPNYLCELTVINNERNQGFTKNVNNGLALSTNHVIILNSDTEVPKDWTSRMVLPFLKDEKISSVTPFSNNASICSFPQIDKENQMPINMTLNEIDSLFRIYGSDVPIPIPVGVGFCMALNRRVINHIGILDENTFGTGYCEENDWCIRAQKAGYINVLTPNLYIYHKMGASFKNLLGNNREKQRETNLKKLLKKHPEFLSQYSKFLNEDPVKPIRDIISRAILIRSSITKNLSMPPSSLESVLKVSCILNSFNSLHDILEAIKSVQAQTYPFWELIIVDDNFNDEMKQELKNIILNEPRCKLIQTCVKEEDRKTTPRFATCINLAIPHITGEFVTYMTDDDIFYPERFEKMIAVFKGNSNVNVVYGKQRVVTLINRKVIREFIRKTDGITQLPMKKIYHNSLMHRTSCFQTVKCWKDHPPLRMQTDIAFFEELSKYWEFHLVDYISDEHRIHENGIKPKLNRSNFPWS